MQHILNGFQRKYLRGQAHSLKPIVMVGQKGVTDMLLQSLDDALNTHELVKLKFTGDKNKVEKERMAEELQRATRSELVGMVGHTAIFYRPHPEKDKRKIEVPQVASGIDSSGGRSPLD